MQSRMLVVKNLDASIVSFKLGKARKKRVRNNKQIHNDNHCFLFLFPLGTGDATFLAPQVVSFTEKPS